MPPWSVEPCCLIFARACCTVRDCLLQLHPPDCPHRFVSTDFFFGRLPTLVDSMSGETEPTFPIDETTSASGVDQLEESAHVVNPLSFQHGAGVPGVDAITDGTSRPLQKAKSQRKVKVVADEPSSSRPHRSRLLLDGANRTPTADKITTQTGHEPYRREGPRNTGQSISVVLVILITGFALTFWVLFFASLFSMYAGSSNGGYLAVDVQLHSLWLRGRDSQRGWRRIDATLWQSTCYYDGNEGFLCFLAAASRSLTAMTALLYAQLGVFGALIVFQLLRATVDPTGPITRVLVVFFTSLPPFTLVGATVALTATFPHLRSVERGLWELFGDPWDNQLSIHLASHVIGAFVALYVVMVVYVAIAIQTAVVWRTGRPWTNGIRSCCGCTMIDPNGEHVSSMTL